MDKWQFWILNPSDYTGVCTKSEMYALLVWCFPSVYSSHANCSCCWYKCIRTCSFWESACSDHEYTEWLCRWLKYQTLYVCFWGFFLWLRLKCLCNSMDDYFNKVLMCLLWSQLCMEWLPLSGSMSQCIVIK